MSLLIKLHTVNIKYIVLGLKVPEPRVSFVQQCGHAYGDIPSGTVGEMNQPEPAIAPEIENR